MPLTIVHRYITKMNVDAAVNAANTDLKMGGGVCGVIFPAARGERPLFCCQTSDASDGVSSSKPRMKGWL